MWKRLFPTRWARIVSWTLAALTWSTTALMAQNTPEVTEAVRVIPPPAPPVAPAVATMPAPLPEAPDDGLVILRYTPVPPPPPEVRTVVVGRATPSSPAAQPPTVVSAGS